MQAQVTGAEQFIPDHEDVITLAMLAQCCNYMINLVFLYSLRTGTLSEMKRNLEGIVQIMRIRQRRLIVSHRCPQMAQTRLVYIVDMLHFILYTFLMSKRLFISWDMK
jgi:hypothetical protein